MEKVTLLLLVLCASVLPCVFGFSSGAGDAACTSMKPSHGTNTATGNAPYSFTVTQTDGSAVTEYSAGQTLRGKSIFRFRFSLMGKGRQSRILS